MTDSEGTRRTRLSRRGTAGGLAGIVLALLMTVWSAAPAPSLAADHERFTPRIGFSASTFVDVDRNDAQAVTDLWAKVVVRKKGGVAETTIYDRLSDLEQDLKLKKIDAVVLVFNEFVELKARNPLEPQFVSSYEREMYEYLVLLVRKDSGIRSLAELRGKSYSQSRGRFASVHATWLETLLLKEGMPLGQRLFSSIADVNKPSQSVMKVFFKQADACIVTTNNFEVMAELNPQLRRELMVLQRSRPLIGGVVAFRSDYGGRNRELLREVLSGLHLDPQGGQLLKMFRMNKLVPFQPEHLPIMESFVREHHDLKTQQSKKGK